VSQPTAKSDLSEGQRRLVELLQRINFGRIEHLRVRGGLPLFEPAPRIIRTLKMGADNQPRSEAELQDFSLKRQTIEMLQVIADLGEGEILLIEAKNGLAFSMEIEHLLDESGGRCG
jgi:hypothetical protein